VRAMPGVIASNGRIWETVSVQYIALYSCISTSIEYLRSEYHCVGAGHFYFIWLFLIIIVLSID
jgi:hypothetical protein